jgi:hypothetical protein
LIKTELKNLKYFILKKSCKFNGGVEIKKRPVSTLFSTKHG